MVNYNISLIWIKAIWGKFPLFTMIPGFGCSEVIIIIIIRCYRVCLRSKWPHRMGSTLDRTHDDAMVTKIDQTCFLTLLEHVGTCWNPQVTQVTSSQSLGLLQNKDEQGKHPGWNPKPEKCPFEIHTIQRPFTSRFFHTHSAHSTPSIHCMQPKPDMQSWRCRDSMGFHGIPWDSKEWSGNDPFACLKIEGTKRG
jgi:hypothetical protein